MYQLPPPPSYFCQYPPPTKSTVDRIGLQMLKQPQFYFRVLDLMQSMNLPAPFFDDVVANKGTSSSAKITKHSKDSKNGSESEVESDDNEKGEVVLVGEKQKMTSGEERKRLKRMLVSAKCHPTIFPKNIPPDVAIRRPQKRIAISLKPTISSSESTLAEQAAGRFGILEKRCDRQKSSERLASPPFVLSTCLRISDVRRNMIKRDEKLSSSLFKNYSKGDISRRLYVKNISKKATKNDLQKLFGVFVIKDTLDGFDVCLLTKGKLHGQAFVTFSNEAQAQNALRETNGYLLHGKPIVVAFARSARK